jgi:ADP-L-glycero-D-manno-heptose 6-epimerase
MIVVTGALGFIGCNLARQLNQQGYNNLILVDDFSKTEKLANISDIQFSQRIERDVFTDWLIETEEQIALIFHLGARTDTTEFNFRILDSLNLAYSKALWEICTVKEIPFIYASSAATYGMGESGFDDDHTKINQLKPLNPYGVSKQLFDEFALKENNSPPHWIGLKFFNVYGPFEFHKKRMASVVFHSYNQIKESGKLKLFKSHKPEYADGEQLRDFVYVADVVDVCLFLFDKITQHTAIENGIYNLGSGKARSFNDLAKAVFTAMKVEPSIEYIPTPEDIRDKYQYFTEAKMKKLKQVGFTQSFKTLEEGVTNYVAFLQNQS